jgi:4-hydroxy-tetrahydrodipicolinate reductase
MKIALLGYGKMGKTIERLALEAGDEIVLRVGSETAASLGAADLKAAEAVIEFSRPEHAFGNIQLCLQAGVPVVCGTTGWLSRLGEVQELCGLHQGAFFYASNFSIGVNIFFALNRYLARMMRSQPQYGAEVQEIHHIHKLDAPSGTAITLADAIVEELSGINEWVNQAPAGEGQLLIRSIREGEVPGTHQVRYDSPLDSIRIYHEAYSREGFAQGALQAAHWLPGRQGCFGMKDMLGFNI